VRFARAFGHKIHQPARRSRSPQRDRTFHVIDEQAAAGDAIVGEHGLPLLHHFEAGQPFVVVQSCGHDLFASAWIERL
jgi:hypothetical protein